MKQLLQEPLRFTLYPPLDGPCGLVKAVTGGAYSRHLKQARRHLAAAIADREMALITQPA